MSIVLSKCPNCDSNLAINDELSVDICPYCNKEYSIHKSMALVANNSNYGNILTVNSTLNRKNRHIHFDFIRNLHISYTFNTLDISVYLDGKMFQNIRDAFTSADCILNSKNHSVQIVIRNSSLAENHANYEILNKTYLIPSGNKNLFVLCDLNGLDCFESKSEYDLFVEMKKNIVPHNAKCTASRVINSARQILCLSSLMFVLGILMAINENIMFICGVFISVIGGLGSLISILVIVIYKYIFNKFNEKNNSIISKS